MDLVSQVRIPTVALVNQVQIPTGNLAQIPTADSDNLVQILMVELDNLDQILTVVLDNRVRIMVNSKVEMVALGSLVALETFKLDRIIMAFKVAQITAEITALGLNQGPVQTIMEDFKAEVFRAVLTLAAEVRLGISLQLRRQRIQVHQTAVLDQEIEISNVWTRSLKFIRRLLLMK